MKGLLTGEGLRFLPSSVPGPARHKASGGKGEGCGGGERRPFPKGPFPLPRSSFYNLILLTGWIEISGVTSWYETTGRP